MSQSWKAVVTLSALHVSGRHWDSIMWHGGPEKLFQGDFNVISQLQGKKRVSLAEAQERVAAVEHFVKTGGQVIGAQGPHELSRLNRAPAPVLCAYLRGNRDLLRRRPTVAIIGTRLPSPKGRERALDLAARLTKAGCLVVSGGANGVDLAAHEGALSVGGETLAVLGETLHPTRDERPTRLRQLEPRGAVTTLTTFGPWIPTARTLFVARNQYVAALADAVVIIEGLLDSGTLHTARFARQMDVPVWVIPGDPENPLAGVANLLLQEGEARALVNVEVLLQSIGIRSGEPEVSTVTALPKVPELELALDGSPSATIEALRSNGGRITLDLLCDALREPVAKLQKDLLELQLMGTIRKEGSEFVLTRI